MVVQTRPHSIPFVLNICDSVFSSLALYLPFCGVQSHDETALPRRNAVETVKTLITVAAGMSFSLAIALLAEELIFGKVFCALFARQAVRVKSAPKR